MTFELWMLLASTGILFMGMNFQAAVGIGAYGFSSQLGARDGRNELPVLVGRGDRAVRNQLESLAMFAPVVIVAHLADVHTPLTQAGAALHVLSRAVFMPVYWSGIPVIRTFVFISGMVGIMMMLFALFMA